MCSVGAWAEPTPFETAWAGDLPILPVGSSFHGLYVNWSVGAFFFHGITGIVTIAVTPEIGSLRCPWGTLTWKRRIVEE